MMNGTTVFVGSIFCFFAVNCAFAVDAEPLLLKSTNTSISLEQVQNSEVKEYGRIKVTAVKDKKTREHNMDFFDADGKSLKRIKLGEWDRPKVSKGKRIIAVQKVGIKDQDLEIYSEVGQLIANVKNIKHYEKVDLLDDGGFVVYGFQFTQHRAQAGGLAFYDNKGALLKNIVIEKMGNSQGSFFGRDNYFALLRKTSASGAVLQCYTREGERKWDYNFTDIAPFNILNAFSVVGDDISVRFISSQQKRTWVFNSAGLKQTEEGW